VEDVTDFAEPSRKKGRKNGEGDQGERKAKSQQLSAASPTAETALPPVDRPSGRKFMA